MATVERRTGVALDTEWLQRPHRHIVLPELPLDPILPPYAVRDLDLDAAYRMAAEPARRAARVRLSQRLANDFGLNEVPGMPEAIAAVASGLPAEQHIDERAITRSTEVPETSPVYATIFVGHHDQCRQRAGVALTTLLGLRSHPETFGSSQAHAAYGDQWSSVRLDILRALKA